MICPVREDVGGLARLGSVLEVLIDFGRDSTMKKQLSLDIK
jgi:hypothetical protein